MTANETFGTLLIDFIGAVQRQRDNANEPLSRTAEADYAKVETARKALFRHVSRLEEDARRLDWLDTQGEPISGDDGYGNQELIGYGWGVRGQCTAIRVAIDEERKAAARLSSSEGTSK